MRIAAARLIPYCLPLSRPWVAASATLLERRGWLLALTAADGTTGWGDCAPLPSSGAPGQERAAAALASLVATLAGKDTESPGEIDAPPEVRWALETALFDLAARRRGLPLARLLGARDLAVPVNAALGALDASAPERAAVSLAQGFSVAKLKVGLAGIDAELDWLRAVAAATGGRLRLRLDANRAWPEAAARRFLTVAAELPVEAVEEPLAEPTLQSLAALQAALPFALAIDESLLQLGADALLSARAVRRLVLKPARLGGIRATLALAARARQAGIDVVITAVVDSAVGVTAAAHVAAALGGPAHGLATSAWLAADVAEPLAIAAGHMRLPELPGLGMTPRCAGA